MFFITNDIVMILLTGDSLLPRRMGKKQGQHIPSGIWDLRLTLTCKVDEDYDDATLPSLASDRHDGTMEPIPTHHRWVYTRLGWLFRS